MLGQILLVKRMGKNKVIAETGAGQHDCSNMAICTIQHGMRNIQTGAQDVERQKIKHVQNAMLEQESTQLPRHSNIKEAVDAAFENWIQNVNNTFYVLARSAVEIHPYPAIVKRFQE